MKTKVTFSLNLETAIYVMLVALSLAAVALMAASTSQFDISRVVYQGF